MSRESNLAKNTVILSLGTFFPKLITVLVTPILTAQLSKAEYGQYDLILTMVSLLLPAATLQVSSAAFRFLIDARKDEEKQKQIASTIFAFVTIMSLVVITCYHFVYGKNYGNNEILISAYFLVDILLISAQQVMRGLGKNYIYSISIIVQSIINTCAIVLLLGVVSSVNLGLTGVLVALILSRGLAFIYILVFGKLWKILHITTVSFDELKKMLQYSWPMVPNNLSNWVLRLSDRLIITAVLGIESNAIYAVANRMPTIFSSLQSTFSLAWQENASIALQDDDRDMYYTKMYNWLFEILVCVMAVLIATTPIIWNVIIRGDYGAAYPQVPVLYLGIFFYSISSTLGGVYIAHMKTRSVGITTMVAAIVNVVVDLLTIKSIGVWAGSVSTLCSYIFLWAYRIIDVQKFQKIDVKKGHAVLGIGVLVFMSILSGINKRMIDVANGVICLVICYIFMKDKMQDIIRLLKRKKLAK